MLLCPRTRSIARFVGILAILTNTYVFADTIYKCTSDSGKDIYTNQKTGSKCKVLSSSPRSPQGSSSSGNRSRATVMPTPGDFPRVLGGEQKNRDNDRRAILEKELSNERENLGKAQKLLTETVPPQKTQAQRDTVALHERNIQALQKELGNLR